MPRPPRLARRGAAVTLALTSCLVFASAPAFADSGNAYTSNVGSPAGHTHFDDRIEVYTVYDDASDYEGVVGWIDVRQADGNWKAYERVYVGTGYGTSKSAYHDVLREAASVRIWACRQDGPYGQPYSCGSAIVPG